MKEFIVIVVTLIIIIAFPLQSLLDTAFNAREQLFDSIVRSYAEQARIEGCFSLDIITKMKTELCDKIKGLVPADIEVVATTEKKYRTTSYSSDSLISFSVSMPENNRFVGGVIFGDLPKVRTYTCAGKVASEALQ